MAFVRYTAERSLIGGHVIGTDYEIEFEVASATRARTAKITNQVSQSGDRESLYYRADEIHDIQTTLIPESDLAKWREFSDSIEDGQEWQVDTEGTVSSPVNVIAGYLVGSVTEQRIAPDWYRFRFRLTRVG